MTVGALTGAAALITVATATNLIVFTAGWVIAGHAMAATFYQAAFAALTRWYGPRRVRALTTLTLAGGLASTVFAPITAALAAAVGWRHTYLILAVTLLLVATPLHWFALRGPWRQSAHRAAPSIEESCETTSRRSPGRRRSRCWPRPSPCRDSPCTRSSSGSSRCCSTADCQPTRGRLGTRTRRPRTNPRPPPLRANREAHHTPLNEPRSSSSPAPPRPLLIALIPGPIWLLLAAAIIAGTVRGNLTLLQATAVTDRWGTTHYARLSALLSAPVTIAAAIAPWAGSALAGLLGSYSSVFLALGAISVIATAFAYTSGRRQAS